MRNILAAAGLFLFLPLLLLGQEGPGPYPAPKAEVFGGYSFVRLEGNSMNGWDFSLAGNVNNNVGIVGEFSGHYNRPWNQQQRADLSFLSRRSPHYGTPV